MKLIKSDSSTPDSTPTSTDFFNNSPAPNNVYEYNGSLTIPSEDLIKVCKKTEIIIQSLRQHDAIKQSCNNKILPPGFCRVFV